MNLLNEIDLAYCDTCGNYVPTVDEDGELLCAYEYAEYPDIATVVGQRVSGCWYSKTKNSKQKVEKMIILELKVTNLDGSQVIKGFSEFARASVLAKYGQLISEGEILDFEVVS